MTCFRRLEYTKTVINSLIESLKNFGDSNIPIYISYDYYDDNMLQYLNNIELNKSIFINDPKIGCNANTKKAISYAMEFSDAVIHIEDDTVLSKDAVRFYVDNLNKYKTDLNIFSISGYNRTITLNPDDIDIIEKNNLFTAWGCAFWKHKFQIISDNWIDLNTVVGHSWDTHINELYKIMGFYQIRPKVSRIQNIGAENGTWVQDANWHYNNHRSPYTSDDICKK